MRFLLVISLFFLFSGELFSQYTSEDADSTYVDSTEKDKNPLRKLPFEKRLYTGGNLNLGISNGYFFMLLSPIVGYKITPKFSTGIGAKYIYYGPFSPKKYGITPYRVYGGSIFSRYLLSRTFFAHVEFQMLNAYDNGPTSPNFGGRAIAKMFFGGLGYYQRFSNNIALQAMLLYDFINDINSPYRVNYLFTPAGPPVIYRLGFIIGL